MMVTRRQYKVLKCSITVLEQKLNEFEQDDYKPILITGDPDGYTVILEMTWKEEI